MLKAKHSLAEICVCGYKKIILSSTVENYNYMKLRPGLLIALVFVSATVLSSCSREYICVCEVAYSGKPGLPDTAYNEYKLRNTQNKAKQECENNSSEKEDDGIKMVETCALY